VKARTALIVALKPNPAVVIIYDLGYDRKAQSNPISFRREKRIEDLLSQFHGDAGS
jgi:hypothetical protein